MQAKGARTELESQEAGYSVDFDYAKNWPIRRNFS